MEIGIAFVVLLAAAVWRFFRRHLPSFRGPLTDVPDASPAAVPSEAPGLTLPYSSVDPFAPPKPGMTRTEIDGTPEPP